MLMYNNAAVDWQSKRANLIPDSSMEAEQSVASRAVKATLPRSRYMGPALTSPRLSVLRSL